jgi:hypothetical protein
MVREKKGQTTNKHPQLLPNNMEPSPTGLGATHSRFGHLPDLDNTPGPVPEDAPIRRPNLHSGTSRNAYAANLDGPLGPASALRITRSTPTPTPRPSPSTTTSTPDPHPVRNLHISPAAPSLPLFNNGHHLPGQLARGAPLHRRHQPAAIQVAAPREPPVGHLVDLERNRVGRVPVRPAPSSNAGWRLPGAGNEPAEPASRSPAASANRSRTTRGLCPRRRGRAGCGGRAWRTGAAAAGLLPHIARVDDDCGRRRRRDWRARAGRGEAVWLSCRCHRHRRQRASSRGEAGNAPPCGRGCCADRTAGDVRLCVEHGMRAIITCT